MRSGAIKVPAAVVNAPSPMCLACQLGRARRRAHTSDSRSIDQNHTKSGDDISADQMEAGYPGMLPTTKGSPTKARYHFCNFWIDHHSRLVSLSYPNCKPSTLTTGLSPLKTRIIHIFGMLAALTALLATLNDLPFNLIFLFYN
jgi:hypothetical protein